MPATIVTIQTAAASGRSEATRNAVIAIGLGLRLRGLARRAPAPRLAADGPIIGVVLGVGLVLVAVWNVLLWERLLPDLPFRGPAATAMYGGVAGFVALMGVSLLWSIYLLVRYALAFNKTRRQALQIFADADRAAVA